MNFHIRFRFFTQGTPRHHLLLPPNHPVLKAILHQHLILTLKGCIPLAQLNKSPLPLKINLKNNWYFAVFFGTIEGEFDGCGFVPARTGVAHEVDGCVAAAVVVRLELRRGEIEAPVEGVVARQLLSLSVLVRVLYDVAESSGESSVILDFRHVFFAASTIQVLVYEGFH